MVMRRYRKFLALTIAGLISVVGAGCEPPPPRLQLTVTTALDGVDDDPGDGVCSSAAAGGACTLRAAIDEGNVAADGADLAVAAGHYRMGPVTVTGDVAVNPASPATVSISESIITVASGARLTLRGINTSTAIRALPPGPNPTSSVSPVRLEVAGEVEVVGSILGGMTISAGGVAVLVDSVAEQMGLANDGQLLAWRSTLAVPASGLDRTVLRTGTGAGSVLGSSVLTVPHATISLGLDFPGGGGTCLGSAPTSASHMFVEVPCGPMSGVGDGSGDAGTTTLYWFEYTGIGYQQVGHLHGLRPTSPLIDAIPVGHPACPVGAVDVYGRPRGVDGNGDGIAGCDIGGVERQP
jgi:hypothetical protein